MAGIRLAADRATYLRANAWLAAVAMAGAMAVLWLLGNPHVWTGAIAGLAGIGVRAWYLASEELAAVWQIDGDRLTGPRGQSLALAQIEALRRLGPMVQVVTSSGDKHLIKYQADPAATVAALRAAGVRG